MEEREGGDGYWILHLREREKRRREIGNGERGRYSISKMLKW